jgi:hypothetical protein
MPRKSKNGRDRTGGPDPDEVQLRAEVEALLASRRQGLEETQRRQKQFREKLARGKTPPRHPRKPRKRGA